VAKQADGSVVVRCGGTVVLSTAVASRTAMEGRDFLPADRGVPRAGVREAAASRAASFKREGRPRREGDADLSPDRPAAAAASSPRAYPQRDQIINPGDLGGQRERPRRARHDRLVGRDGALRDPVRGPGRSGAGRAGWTASWSPTPPYKQVAASPLELVMAGNEDAILMVESGGKEIAEEQMLEALAFGHERCKELTRIQKDLVARRREAALGLRARGASTRRSRRAEGSWPRPRWAKAPVGAREAGPGQDTRGDLRRDFLCRRGRRDPSAPRCARPSRRWRRARCGG